jgi:hypothetical protein
MNKRLKKFFGIKASIEKDWDFLCQEIQNAEQSNDKNSGEALFMQILKELPFFSRKKREYTKHHFKKYREKV